MSEPLSGERVSRWRAFWYGAARVLDLGATLPPLRDPLRRTDAEALASDWEAVGGDLQRALDSVSRRPSEGRDE